MKENVKIGSKRGYECPRSNMVEHCIPGEDRKTQ